MLQQWHELSSETTVKVSLFTVLLNDRIVFMMFFILFDFRCEMHSHHPNTTTAYSNGLRQHPSRSRSVPEGLAHYPMQGCDCQWSSCHNNRWHTGSFRHHSRPIHVVEQITTSV